MSVNEEKIALIVEAVNRFKGTFADLQSELQGVDDKSRKLQTSNKGMLDSMKENWLAVSVAIAAAGAVIAKAFDFMEKGAKAEQAEKSFRSVAAAAGESADEIIEAMKRAANGTVDDSDIMQKAVKGMMQGLSGTQLVQIMEAARVSARATGEDVGTVYESITDALANKMPKALLRYGLVTKEQMKLLEASMAAGTREVDLFGIAMANAADQSAKMGGVLENNAEKIQKLKALWSDIKETIGNAIWDLISGIKSLATGTIDVVMGVMTGAIAGIIGVFLVVQTGLNKLGLTSDATLAKTREDFEKLKNASKDFFSSAFGNKPKAPAGPATAPAGNTGAAGNIEDQMRSVLAMKAREAEIAKQIADIDIAEKERSIAHLDAAQKRVDLTKELLEVQEKNLAAIDKEKSAQAWAAQQKAIDDTKRKLSDLGLALRELNGTFEEGFSEGFKRYLDTVKSTFQQAATLAQEAAKAMEQAFSDFFFDAMTGKLKKFSDYIKSFLLSVARAIANVMAQNAAAGIVSSFSGSSGSGSTGTTAPASGGNVGFAHNGAYILHQGGYVPRFHIGGLMSDERPAILQTGEGVLSRRGMAALDALNNGGGSGGGMSIVVQVENKSSQAVKATQGPTNFNAAMKQITTSVFLEDMEFGGPMRKSIEGLK